MARKTPRTKTITSRSLTLTTSNFCFDFTWRKVELEEPDQSPLRVPALLPPQKKQESFASILRRKQIDDLIAPRDEAAPELTPPIAAGPLAPPSKAQAWRSYRQASLLEIATDPDKDGYV